MAGVLGHFIGNKSHEASCVSGERGVYRVMKAQDKNELRSHAHHVTNRTFMTVGLFIFHINVLYNHTQQGDSHPRNLTG